MSERKLTVVLAGDARQASQAFGQVERDADRFGLNVGKIGPKITAALTAAAAAVAVGAAKMFGDWDDGLDAIKAGTGATGDALAGLEDSMEQVAASSVQGLGEVGAVMAEVSQRTHLVGPALEALTEAFLELDQLGMPASIEAVSQVFTKWKVATQDQIATLDHLFQVSQVTGVGIDRMTELLVSFGGPLQQLGYDLRSATALLAAFERDGVNTEAVLGSMRKAISALAGQLILTDSEVEQLQGSLDGLRSKAEAAAASVDTAGGRVEDARQRFADLSVELREAGEALREALEGPSSNDIEGAELGIARARNSAQDTAADLAEAEDDLKDIRLLAIPGDLEDAERKVRDLRLSSRESVLSIADAEQRLRDVRAQGTEQDESVISARERIRDVSRQMVDADESIIDAQAAMVDATQAAVDAAGAVAQAQTDLASANKPIGDAAGLWAGFVEQVKAAPDALTAAQIAIDLIGTKGGPALAGAIRDGRFELEELDDLLSQNTISDAAEATESLADEVSKWRNQMTSSLGPYGEYISLGATLLGGLIPLALALTGVGVGGTAAGAGLMAALWPIALVVAAVALLAGAAYLIIQNWEPIKRFFGEVWEDIQGGWDKVLEIGGGVVDWFTELPGKIKDGLLGVGKILLYPFMWAFDQIARLWNSTVGSLSFSIPSWVPGVGGKGFDVPDLPRIKMAAGGIVRARPGGVAATIGEGRYDEAVIPLDGRHGMGGTTINVNLSVTPGGEAEAGRVIVRYLDSFFKAGGTSARLATR